MRRINYSLLLMALGTLFQGCGNSTHKEEAKKLNLLFVFTDQQSYDMIGVSGNKQVITPHLDNLAKEGVYFSHALSNQPLCTPYRGMLLSGQHPLYNGCWRNDVPLLPNNGTSFAQALNSAGYETAYIGKWHLYGGKTRDTGIPSGENRQGFNGTFLTNNVTVDFSPEASFYWNDQNEKVFFKDVYPDHPWELEAQTRQTEEWLKDYNQDKPFALFVSWHPPHDFVGDACPQIDGRQYNYDVSVLDSSLIDPYKGMDIKLRPDIPTNDEFTACRKEQYSNYMAMVTACDNSVGRLIQVLKEKGEYENTLIVFTSDHGDMIGSHHASFPKNRPQDYSIRIPLIMSCKKVLPADQNSRLLISSMDLMPTILGLMDIPVPASVQGADLKKAILDGNDDAVDYAPIFVYDKSGWKGVVTHDWTYTESVDTKVTVADGAEVNVLYNRAEDPGQIHNLFGNEKYAGIQQELQGKMHEWMAKYGDKSYSTNDFNKIKDKTWWEMNYTTRPIDVFKQAEQK